MNTVAQLKDSVAGLLQGRNLNNVTNLFGAFQRAARTLIQRADVPEASGRYAFMLYDGVYDYLAPPSIFGGALNDMRPQGNSRTEIDYAYKQPVDLFDRTKHSLPNGYKVTFEYNNGTPIMRVASPNPQERIVLDPMSDTTGWAAGGNASGLAVDTTVYYDQPAALRFNLAANGTQGTLTKTLEGVVDLTDYVGVGVAFLAVDLPVGGLPAITSIGVKIGSDATDYYSVSNTQGILGAWVVQDWLLVALDLSLATQIGNPVANETDYVQVFVNYASTAQLTNMRVGGLWISLPAPTEVLFQSSFIFQNATTGVLSNSIGSLTDIVILGDAAFGIYEHECALTIALQGGAAAGSALVGMLEGVLYGADGEVGLYTHYRADNPSEQLRSVGNYYDDDSSDPYGGFP